MMLSSLIVISTLFIAASPLHLYLKQPRTCLMFEVQDPGDKLNFNFHYNTMVGSVNLLIFGSQGKVIDSSGDGPDYKTFIEASFPESGEYQMCFMKRGMENMQVHFDINKSSEQHEHAGTEDLGKLTRRIGQFLVEIKKTGLQYKEVLSQHNNRQQRLVEYEESSKIFYAIKAIVMIAILAVQVWAIRKIFE